MRFPTPPRVLACLLLAGCALVDQNTFAPAPEAKAQPAAQPPAAVKLDTRVPLVTIDFSGPQPDYTAMLNYAVRAADMRDRDVQFDVIAVVPKSAALAQGQRDAAEVMRSIMLGGIPPDRIHLGLQADPVVTGREIRVYVR